MISATLAAGRRLAAFPFRPAAPASAGPSRSAAPMRLVTGWLSLAGLLLAAGCGGGIDGGLQMRSHALQITPQVVAPSPAGTGTFTMEVSGDSEGDRYEAQIYFSAVLADQRTERPDSGIAPMIKSVCLKTGCGQVIRYTCTLAASQSIATPRRIDCTDSLGNRGVQDVAPGDFRVTAYFFPGNALGYDDDYVDSTVPMTLQ